ncbi:MAG: serine hydrolase domain-containing protein, partial [Pseudomonadota bacterium]
MSLRALATVGPKGSTCTDDAPRPWWSVTKTAIAATALRLAERHVVALDAPMSEGWTLRDLLAHRAGLSDYGPLPAYKQAVAAGDPPWSPAEVLARVGPPTHRPREIWRYSNVGYMLARARLEDATGRSLGSLLSQEVLAPLGLTQTRLSAGVEPDWSTYDFRWVYHGCLFGPPSEAAAMVHGILMGPILSPAMREALRARVPLGDGIPGRPWQSIGYGLGLMMGQ